MHGASGKDIYLIGIGGCGMSGLARLLRSRGARVSGSDVAPSQTTDALAREGFRIGFDQPAGLLPDACSLAIASAAIKPDHPELLAAQARGIPILTYAEALGRCMEGSTGVSIAGTHGKSTTTAMLGAALVDAGLDPSVIVGATCPQLALGSLSPRSTPVGFRLGSPAVPAGTLAGRPGILIAEACEFIRSFHHHRPMVASISSVEADHLDVYGSLDAIVEAFRDFARLLPPAAEGGRLLIAHKGAHRREVASGLGCGVETIGFSPSADWVVEWSPADRRVALAHRGASVASWTQRIPGEHNAMNAATACALAIMLGAEPKIVARSLGSFLGVDRRTQLLGEVAWPPGRPPTRRAGSAGATTGPTGTIRVYDDYGHHPTEVEATLRALREFERPEARGGRLICVFQPHQHSRTRHLLEEFASAFSSADIVIVPHIYFVRDSLAEKQKVAASDLVDRLRSRGIRAMHLYPFEAIVEQLQSIGRAGDLLVVMGAGPVWEVARAFLEGASMPEEAHAHPHA